MQKWKLIGSAGSLETLARGIKNYYCSPPLFVLQDDGSNTVSTGSGPKAGVRIIWKRGRYRFERLEDDVCDTKSS